MSSISEIKKKNGFTLVEVMFVILIISLLAVMAVNAYVEARFRSLVMVQADKIAVLLRETKFRVERGDSYADKPLCLGLAFDSGDKIDLLQGEFVSAEDGCDNFKNNGVYELSYPVKYFIEQPFTVYFEPPKSVMRVTLQDGKFEADKKEVVVNLGNGSRKDLARTVVLDPITSSVTVKVNK